MSLYLSFEGCFGTYCFRGDVAVTEVISELLSASKISKVGVFCSTLHSIAGHKLAYSANLFI